MVRRTHRKIYIGDIMTDGIWSYRLGTKDCKLVKGLGNWMNEILLGLEKRLVPGTTKHKYRPSPGGPSSCTHCMRCFWYTRFVLTLCFPEELIPWLKVTGSVAHAALASFSSLSHFLPALTDVSLCHLSSQETCIQFFVLGKDNNPTIFVYLSCYKLWHLISNQTFKDLK